MRRPTLTQFFVAAAVSVVVIVLVAFGLFVRSARVNVLRSAERQQDLAAQRIEARVVRELGRARRALDDVEHGIHAGAIEVDEPSSLEANLFTRLSGDEHLVEITFTRATRTGFTPGGAPELAPDGRWSLTVDRTRTGAVQTKVIRQARVAGPWVAATRERPPGARFDATTFREEGEARDPTLFPAFGQTASRAEESQLTWSDLHWSELDRTMPQEQQRVVVSVHKAITTATGFLGVLRVAIVTSELDTIGRVETAKGQDEDVQRVALLATPAASGGVPRLLARVRPNDRMVASRLADELGVATDDPPPEVAALLASPVVRHLDRAHPERNEALVVDGTRWLATLRAIELEGRGGTTGWMVAVLAPEDRYTTDLARFERTFVLTFGATFALVAVIATLTLIFMRRGLGHVSRATARMRGFDFTASDDRSAFRDVDDVMVGLERAKTVVRAMGKYVPVDLVRRLYEGNREPELGGEPLDVSIMFTDIEGFTTLAEELPPPELAQRLGAYLGAMTSAIESTGGTIDKYVGDAVMALFNAPTPLADHPRKACRAALACMAAAHHLYASRAWSGLGPMVTRFGIHTDRVLVGHFGAPTRLGYTALGDGVNLAARLEPLCKQYGVVALVSEHVVALAHDEFVFRRVDRVAVKGKTHCIDVYELLGARDGSVPAERLGLARRYEEAFDAYLAREFERAGSLLARQLDDDAPSRVLAARCAMLAGDPPPATWNGVHVAMTK